MRKLSFLLLIAFISCNYKMEQKEATEKAENKVITEDSLDKIDATPARPKSEFEIFGEKFLKHIYNKETNRIKEYLLDTIINYDNYNKISKDSFLSNMFISPFDSYALKGIKDRLEIHFLQGSKMGKKYFYTSARAITDDSCLHKIEFFSNTVDKNSNNLIILEFIHSKNGFRLYKYSILEFHSH